MKNKFEIQITTKGDNERRITTRVGNSNLNSNMKYQDFKVKQRSIEEE